MIALALGLTIAAVLLELTIVYQSDVLAARLERSSFSGIAFSIALSWLLGIVFGAAGLIVMFAATVSTILTAAVYRTGLLKGIKRLSRATSRLTKRNS